MRSSGSFWGSGSDSVIRNMAGRKGMGGNKRKITQGIYGDRFPYMGNAISGEKKQERKSDRRDVNGHKEGT